MPGMLDSREPFKKTKLSATDEKKFQDYVKNTAWYNQYKAIYGEAPDLNASDYDYRGAYKAGVEPVKYEFDNSLQHWPSKTPEGQSLKSPDHATAWMEDFMRTTGTDPLRLGIKSPEEAWNYVRDLKR